MPTRLQSFSNILLSRCSRLSCVTEKRRALLSLPGNRTRSSTGRNQAVSGPAALVGIRNGGREGIRTPGLLIANEALSQLSYSPTSSKSILAKARVLANTPIVRKHVGAHHLSRLGRDAAPPITENGTLRVALTAARRARPRAGPRSSWHSGTAPVPAESLPRPSVLVGRLRAVP